MRILYVQTLRLDVDLCRTSRLGIARELGRLGCDVTLVAGFDRTAPRVDGLRVELVSSLSVPLLRQLSFSLAVHARVLRLLLGERFDIVMLDPYTVFCAFPVDVLVRLGILKRPRMVLDLRSGIFHVRHRAVSEWARKVSVRLAMAYARSLFAGFTTITPTMRDWLAREFRLPLARTGVWQSGVDLTIRDAPQFAAVPIPSGAFVVGYHGSFGIDRGLEETVQAMHLLRDRCPDVVLALLGDGTQAGELRRLTGPAPNIVFLDPVPPEAVPGFIRRCDVGILPFKPTPVMRGSSPLKLMEYLAFGKPVIASRIEAIAGVLGEEPAAIYLKDQTPDAIADAIAIAAEHRHELPAWGQRGRAIIEARYTWQHQATTLKGFLESLA